MYYSDSVLSKKKRLTAMQRLVLASSSPYRRDLLARLGIPFEAISPDIDETPLPDESPETTAARLAEKKAAVLVARFPDALIIGSDQVVEVDGAALGKPLTHENALRQLRHCSGRTVVFQTALCLLDAATGGRQVAVATNRVRFRELSDDEIERYLRREQPYDCAGSAKVDALGIVLIEALEGDDPNALIGLPLILLVDMLRRTGVVLP
jgi:septum formation protein